MDADKAVKLYHLYFRITAYLVYLANYLNEPFLRSLDFLVNVVKIVKISYIDLTNRFFTFEENAFLKNYLWLLQCMH